MWHVPHLNGQYLARALLGMEERAFVIRGTRFWASVRALGGGKKWPDLVQNTADSPDADRPNAQPHHRHLPT